jgi:hypothetical protein
MKSLNEMTLKQSLSCLAQAHQLSEVLDRLSELADNYGEVSPDSQAAHEWQLVARGLETLTLHVKRIEAISNSR